VRLDLPNGLALFDNRERDWRNRLSRQESTSKTVVAVRRLRWPPAVSCMIIRGVGVTVVTVTSVAIPRSEKSLGLGAVVFARTMITATGVPRGMIMQRVNNGRRQ
jgi:hypothetical protein